MYRFLMWLVIVAMVVIMLALLIATPIFLHFVFEVVATFYSHWLVDEGAKIWGALAGLLAFGLVILAEIILGYLVGSCVEAVR